VSGIRRCSAEGGSGVRKQLEVIANFVAIEGIGENIGANDSRRKAAQVAIPKNRLYLMLKISVSRFCCAVPET
jgi:hypothetical protein